MENEKAEVKVIKLSVGQRINYGIEQLGYNYLYYWVSAFMAIFCTDVLGIKAGIVSALIMVCRVFDCVNDPVIGTMTDRSKPDKRGNRYSKWVRWGSIGLSIFVFLLFFTRPEWPMKVKVAWICIVYMVITVFSTATDMPFGAMNNVLTNDSIERGKLSAMRMLFAQLGSQLCGVVAVGCVALFSVGGSAANGYAISVAIGGVLLVITAGWTSTHCREVVKPVKSELVPVKKALYGFFRNKYIVIACLAMFCNGFNAYSTFMLLTYFFTYYAGNAALISVYSMVSLVAGILGSGFLSAWLVQLFKGSKNHALQLTGALQCIFYLILFIIPVSSPLFFVVIFFGYLASSTSGGIIYGVIGDAADYGEYISGFRADGFNYSFADLMLKFGGAVGPSVCVALLGTLGYVPNAVQNSQVLFAMHGFITFLPAVVGALILILFSFYNLDEKKHKEILGELEKRRTE